MPVNQTPKRKRPSIEEAGRSSSADKPAKEFGQETDQDREKDRADAESKNLWDQTEVIDMDTF